LKFITPQSIEELAPHKSDVEFLHHFSPLGYTSDEQYRIIESFVPAFSLVYANGILIGCFIFDIHKRSVELHGILRPDIKQIVPQANLVKIRIFEILLNEIFNVMGKDKVIIKGKPEWKGVNGFARMWGFERLQNMEKGKRVWKLTKEGYNKQHEQINAECTTSNEPVCGNTGI